MNEFEAYIQERQERLAREQSTIQFWLARNKRNLWPLVSATLCFLIAGGLALWITRNMDWMK